MYLPFSREIRPSVAGIEQVGTSPRDYSQSQAKSPSIVADATANNIFVMLYQPRMYRPTFRTALVSRKGKRTRPGPWGVCGEVGKAAACAAARYIRKWRGRRLSTRTARPPTLCLLSRFMSVFEPATVQALCASAVALDKKQRTAFLTEWNSNVSLLRY